jgi:hypothetical protein
MKKQLIHTLALGLLFSTTLPALAATKAGDSGHNPPPPPLASAAMKTDFSGSAKVSVGSTHVQATHTTNASGAGTVLSGNPTAVGVAGATSQTGIAASGPVDAGFDNTTAVQSVIAVSAPSIPSPPPIPTITIPEIPSAAVDASAAASAAATAASAASAVIPPVPTLP